MLDSELQKSYIMYEVVFAHDSVDPYVLALPRTPKVKVEAMLNSIRMRGGQAINGRTIKQLKGMPNSVTLPILELKVVTKPHRLFGVLSPSIFWLVYAFDKKRDDITPKHRKIIIDRASELIKTHSL